MEPARSLGETWLERAEKYFREADTLEAKSGRTMTPAAAKKLVSTGPVRAPTKGVRARRKAKDSP